VVLSPGLRLGLPSDARCAGFRRQRQNEERINPRQPAGSAGRKATAGFSTRRRGRLGRNDRRYFWRAVVFDPRSQNRDPSAWLRAGSGAPRHLAINSGLRTGSGMRNRRVAGTPLYTVSTEKDSAFNSLQVMLPAKDLCSLELAVKI
jgi:hypothetical protein